MSWELGCAHLAACAGRDLQRAARKLGGPRKLWESSPERIATALGLEGDAAADLVGARHAFDPARARANLAACGVAHIGLDDVPYPSRLRDLPDPPFGLFVAGQTPSALNERGRPVVAVVGSRRPSGHGLQFARELARGLAGRGALIVSGLAMGIDAAAHEGALQADRATVAVVGAGVDVQSPRRNAGLRERIVASGCVVSEYWPGTEPAPWRFPARNRIIAGLVDAVVVVEAGERSGALITADFALELGRPVLAVPGLPASEVSAGCHALLRAGAALCDGIDDVIAECGPDGWVDVQAEPAVRLDGVDAEIHGLLVREPLLIDEILDRLDAPTPAVLAAIGRLELEGRVVKGHGQRYWAAARCGAAR